jgi:hypothetical protein
MKRSNRSWTQAGWLPVFLITLAVPRLAEADAVNEDRILRKAGGIADGNMTNVKFRINGGPLQDSFNRTGKVRIRPTRVPRSRSSSTVRFRTLISTP